MQQQSPPLTTRSRDEPPPLSLSPVPVAATAARPDRLEIGLLATTWPPKDRLLSGSITAEQKGYDALWWPDHLMGMLPRSLWTVDVVPMSRLAGNPDVYLDTVASIAAVAVSTSTIRLAAGVTEAVRRHPAMLANEWLTLDHLSEGRAILGIGAGEAENITPYGLSHERPVARLEEALTIIRRLWESNDTVDYEGQFWTLDRAVCGLTPFAEGQYPPIWVGGQGPRMLKLTARHGDGWIPTHLPAAEYALKASEIRRAALAYGRDPSSIAMGFGTGVILADTTERARELVIRQSVKAPLLFLPEAVFAQRGFAHPLGAAGSGQLGFIPTHLDRAEAIAAVDAIPDEIAIEYVWHGTPDDIVAQTRQYVEGGLQHLQLGNLTYLADIKSGIASEGLMDDLHAQLRAIVPAAVAAP